MHEHLDLKRKKTYAALLRAFEALMKEKSFDELTVHELCPAARSDAGSFGYLGGFALMMALDVALG